MRYQNPPDSILKPKKVQISEARIFINLYVLRKISFARKISSKIYTVHSHILYDCIERQGCNLGIPVVQFIFLLFCRRKIDRMILFSNGEVLVTTLIFF